LSDGFAKNSPTYVELPILFLNFLYFYFVFCFKVFILFLQRQATTGQIENRKRLNRCVGGV
jgi:hypothetical protein